VILTTNAAAGPDEISFAPGLTGTIPLAEAPPHLASDITLRCPGATRLMIRRQIGGSDRTLPANSGTTVTLSGLTIANGRAYDAGGIDARVSSRVASHFAARRGSQG
jgi:hypothetical protein